MKKHIYLVCMLLVCGSYLPAQNNLRLITYSNGYTSPLGIENCGDNRLFIVQQTGQIMVCSTGGKKLSKPFLDISDRIISGGEQGLLGLAFHPDFLANGFFYVNYINQQGNTQISRFKVLLNNRNMANNASEKKILEIHQPYPNHNGGCIRFGPDGYLYIGMGDGGNDGSNGGDPQNYAQNTSSLLGKMLRIDVNSGDAPYKIPRDNPFLNKDGYLPEIWALGLRNPWRWSFDATSGALIIADVGQDLWEEVNLQYSNSKGGENYGWRSYEGNYIYNTSGNDGIPKSAYTFPKYEYAHSASTGDCSVTGGFVYRGKKYPDMYGKYYFTDYCSGIIRSLLHTKNNDKFTVTEQDEYKGDMYAYVSFGEDNNNELYLVNQINGTIYQVASANTLTAQTALPTASLSVYPNPAATYCTASYTTAKAEACTVSLHNTLGMEIFTAKKMSIAGKNNWQIIIPADVKGECYITVTTVSGTRIRQSVLIE